MMDLKEEYFGLEEVDGSIIERSFAANESYEVLKQTMKSVFLVYNVQVQALLEAVEHYGESMLERVETIVCSPPYNLGRTSAPSNAKHDFLSVQDMTQFVEVLTALIEVGKNGHLLWRRLQFKK